MGYSIQTFHTGFLICLTAMIISLALAVLLFFVFDIRTIYSIRSGKAQRKDIEKNKELNLKTDQLGRRRSLLPSGGLGRTGQTKGKSGQTKGNSGKLGDRQLQSAAPTAATSAAKSAETASLDNQDTNSTTVLKAVLNPGEQVPQAPVGFKFVIQENTLVIHTQEMIV